MVTKASSKNSRPTPDIDAQPSENQQAEAIDSQQVDPRRRTKQEALLRKTGSIIPDVGEDDIPPPTYGEIYGEIRNEKGGVGTSARVTNDGRVNISINQANRRLSQIFIPALRQQIRDVEDSSVPPYPYIPPSLGGEAGIPPPPLNIVIQVVGSRGDVQPFVALGKVLRDTYGHRVRLATHPTFKDFVQENGLEFFSIGADPSRLMAFMVKNPSLMPGVRTLLSGDIGQRRKDVSEYIQGCWRSCYEAGDGMGLRATSHELSGLSQNDPSSELEARPFVADCIIANPPSFAHIHCAEKLGIPLHIMFTMPYSPTQAFPHPLANIQSSNADPQLTNYLSYAMIEVLSWQGLGDIMNRFRAKCLDLDPVSMIWAPGMLERLKIPHTYCWSPSLIPKPKDWGPHISTAGFYFLNSASDYNPTPDLRTFLDAGPPPVYIGFGSIVLDDPNAMTELIFEAVKQTGQRVLLSKGWGGIGADNLHVPDSVHILGNVPHDWLFQHVSCVVHHGGAGTTAAGIAAGRPTVVVPFFGDQPFWGAMVARAGAGPKPIPHKQLTADNLADAMNFCLKPEVLGRAKDLASKIAGERGSDTGAQSFHQFLEVDRLRCTLAVSRAAVWRIRRTQVRLSAFAACTLANANLLDFQDLKPFRSREYNTDEGPWDPVSGGAAACYRAFSGMALGLAEVPSETIKAFQMPRGSARRQSEASVSMTVRKLETSHEEELSTTSSTAGQSRTSLSVQEVPTRARSPASLSVLSVPDPKIESSSISDSLQGESSLTRRVSGQGQVHSQNESGFGKDRDMLRRAGAHSSKGFGRFMTAFAQTPTGVTVGLTRGFHNLPKLWGDDTVRPQEQVSGFKSGAVAAGKEFGFGLYDGVTGLVTQPWKGAQKEGAKGFAKGFGKGIGGFASKPSAGISGLLGYMMKGIQKEIQKPFGSNLQSYIAASRVAQGYDEWLQSSDAEKQDVIDRWKLIQQNLKKNFDPDKVVQDGLKAQRGESMEGTTARQTSGHTTNYADSANADAPTSDHVNTIPATGDLQLAQGSIEAANFDDTMSPPIQQFSRGHVEEEDGDDDVQHWIQETVSLQERHQEQEDADYEAEQEDLHRAMTASELDARQHTSEALEYKRQLEMVMAQSVLDQRQTRHDRAWESNVGLRNEDDYDFDLATRPSELMAEAVAGGSSSTQRPDLDDSFHLAGTTQREFEAQQRKHPGEKTMQQRTEEEIVMEYVKKQSLLEASHKSRGKNRATGCQDDDDDDS